MKITRTELNEMVANEVKRQMNESLLTEASLVVDLKDYKKDIKVRGAENKKLRKKFNVEIDMDELFEMVFIGSKANLTKFVNAAFKPESTEKYVEKIGK